MLPIAFLDRRSASAAATTRLARQLPIVGHDSPRRTSRKLQFQGELVKSAPGARRRRTPVFAPSTTASKRVETRQRGFDHRRPRQALYTTNTFGTLLNTFQTPIPPSRAVSHLQQLQHPYARRACATQAGSEESAAHRPLLRTRERGGTSRCTNR